MWEINIILNLFKDFGVNIAGFGIIIYLVWKLGTNHLKHIADDVKSVAIDVKSVASEVKEIKSQTAAHGERIATLEGKMTL